MISPHSCGPVSTPSAVRTHLRIQPTYSNNNKFCHVIFKFALFTFDKRNAIMWYDNSCILSFFSVLFQFYSPIAEPNNTQTERFLFIKMALCFICSNEFDFKSAMALVSVRISVLSFIECKAHNECNNNNDNKNKGGKWKRHIFLHFILQVFVVFCGHFCTIGEKQISLSCD